MGKVLVVVFISLTLLLSDSPITMAYEKEIKSLSSNMSENIVKAGKKSIAVVDFTDLQGNVTELGRFIAEEFSVALASAGKGFEVVDRTHLKTILKEHKLAITGVIDPTTAKKLGQVAGVDALITGSITPFGDSVRISVKILDTATAKVIGASSGDIPKTKAIEELLGRGIEATSGTASPSQAKPKALAKAEVRSRSSSYGRDYDFTLEARECKATRQGVNCTIAVVNNTPKIKHFRLYELRESILVDDFSNQYQPTKGGFSKGRESEAYDDSKDIPPDLPINFSLIYDDVPTTTKYVTVIVQIQRVGQAVLRNIPLTK